MDLQNIKEVPVVVYGNLEQYNEVLSKGRCRIFYKYMNRNGTYITDEFAERLISTLPYAPVKGIYDDFNEDYTNHGNNRNEGRIYGIVPADPNLRWELHVDEDGVEREYACVDVLLFTGIYNEASEIIGKAQSMEIYEPSIKGEWMTIEGRKAFVFTDGCFLGLQVLGDETEPCFEGAAFFSLYKSLSDLVTKLDTYEKNLNNPESNEGGQTMPNINFKLSDDAKYEMLFNALNPNYNEEGQWDVDYMIVDVYDGYAVAYACKKGGYERVYYSKDDASNTVTINEFKKCFIVDISEEEQQALDAIQALNGGTYEKIDENFGSVADFEEKMSEKEQKIEELNASISTLTEERDKSISKCSEHTEKIEALTSALDALNEYKMQVETNEKEAVFSKYATRINEEVLNSYREKISEFTVNELEKELAFELVNTNPSIFELDSEDKDLLPKSTNTKSAMEQLLDRYEK